jgi:hypothetical protein
MITVNISSFPDDLEGSCVEAGCSGRTEGDVNPALLNHRSGRGIGIERVAVLRLGDVKEFQVVTNPACVAIQTKGVEAAAIRSGCRQPDLITLNDRGRPASVVNRNLPDDILCFTPMKREPNSIRVPIAIRASELRPMIACITCQTG